jgi:hypothetical protein
VMREVGIASLAGTACLSDKFGSASRYRCLNSRV